MVISFRNKTADKKDDGGDIRRPSLLSKIFRLDNFTVTSRKKFALVIGDEGAILAYIEKDAVKSRNFISSASPENLSEFSAILAKDPSAPIYMIVDSMDQSFIQQSLPPISQFGLKKMIKQRLERSLGKDTIKGYLMLEREKTGRRDWNFLMVSLEKSPQIVTWLDFLESVENRLENIFLLSVESENIIKTIDNVVHSKKKTIGKDEKTPANDVWKFFVSNNKVGGFRQVILKNGRMVFTRLGQSVGDTTPEVIAGSIEQEMASTIEYMKRLSFNPQDGLDVYIVASEDVGNAIDTTKIPSKNIYKLTPFDVAGFLEIPNAAKQTDQFGDIVMSVAIANSRKHRMPLSIPQAEKVNTFFKALIYQRVLAFAIAFMLISYGIVQFLNFAQKYNQELNLERTKSEHKAKLDKLNAEIAQSGVDIKKVNETVTLYNNIIRLNTDPLPLLHRLRSLILPSVIIRDVSWRISNDETPVAAPANGDAESEKTGIFTFTLRFPEIASTDEEFAAIARKVIKDLRAALPDYRIVYLKLPDALSKKNEAGRIGLDSGSGPVKIAKEQLEATLSVSLPSKDAPKAPVQDDTLAGGKLTSTPVSTDELIGLGKEENK